MRVAVVELLVAVVVVHVVFVVALVVGSLVLLVLCNKVCKRLIKLRSISNEMSNAILLNIWIQQTVVEDHLHISLGIEANAFLGCPQALDNLFCPSLAHPMLLPNKATAARSGNNSFF